MQNTLNNYYHQTEDIIVSLKPENRDFFEKNSRIYDIFKFL